MPTFNDSENLVPFVPEGDYVFCVTEFDQGISAGGQTAGCTKYELTLEVELKDGARGPRVFENLIDDSHRGGQSKCAWKIDTFIKSAGVTLPKGAAFEFNADDAASNGAHHVPPLGLRGWCRLVVEEYPANSGKRRNKVATFYTNKPKLPARVIETRRTDDGVDGEDIPF
jgi:hypothetical protein